MFVLMICALILTPSTPEEFLDELCINSSGPEGAEYWAGHAYEEVQYRLSHSDSLRFRLDRMRELSVDPGPRTAFIEEGDHFRIEFGQSEWTWYDPDGNVNRKEGLTVVMVTDGDYSWFEIPVLEEGSLRIGNRERLMSGMLLTFLLLVTSVVLVAWAKRRYL